MKKYPMKLTSVPRSIIWGGDKLKKIYGKKAPFDKIAESWELTVRDDGMSVIENDEYSSLTMGSFLEKHPNAVGESFKGQVFPLLIKFIDAADDVSVQVHPDDSYASLHETDSGKTEMWYILEADENAEIIYGVKDDVDPEMLKNALSRGDYDSVLRRVKVKKGDVYFIPSGQIHALCRGVLLAEIQQNSNITYRIYDYDRVGTDGKKRELHTVKALDTVKCYTDLDVDKWRFSKKEGRREAPNGFKILADCKYFRVCSADLGLSQKIRFTVDESSFASLLFTSAEDASVTAGDVNVKAYGGDSFFLPAGIGEVTVSGSCTVIFSEP